MSGCNKTILGQVHHVGLTNYSGTALFKIFWGDKYKHLFASTPFRYP